MNLINKLVNDKWIENYFDVICSRFLILFILWGLLGFVGKNCHKKSIGLFFPGVDSHTIFKLSKTFAEWVLSNIVADDLIFLQLIIRMLAEKLVHNILILALVDRARRVRDSLRSEFCWMPQKLQLKVVQFLYPFLVVRWQVLVLVLAELLKWHVIQMLLLLSEVPHVVRQHAWTWAAGVEQHELHLFEPFVSRVCLQKVLVESLDVLLRVVSLYCVV